MDAHALALSILRALLLSMLVEAINCDHDAGALSHSATRPGVFQMLGCERIERIRWVRGCLLTRALCAPRPHASHSLRASMGHSSIRQKGLACVRMCFTCDGGLRSHRKPRRSARIDDVRPRLRVRLQRPRAPSVSAFHSTTATISTPTHPAAITATRTLSFVPTTHKSRPARPFAPTAWQVSGSVQLGSLQSVEPST